jgi:hypothetical protein
MEIGVSRLPITAVSSETDMTVRSDDAQAHSVSPWKHTRDSPPHKFKYHCQRTSPIAIDPFDHNTVYYGCQRQNHELTKNDVICRADPHQSIFRSASHASL